MITVAEALDRVLALGAPLGSEEVPLGAAAGRVLARPVAASRAQPPFAASAMDGYAVRATDAAPGAVLRVVGEAAAGHGHAGHVAEGEALRIFTGAPVPAGADRVVIQEDVTREGDRITLGETLDKGFHVRPLGGDFQVGDTLAAPRRLRPADLALLAAMNIARVPVTRKPVVALIATGDELVMPGEAPRADQIIASNSFGLQAMIEAEGAEARLLPIARDTAASLEACLALAEGADLVVTIGGASVGDHDLVGAVAGAMGLDRAFYKIAMRPGKPLMAGHLAGAAMLGLPGNPVSSMVCGHIFMLPLIRRMLGLRAVAAPEETARLAAPLPKNGPREHYMRGTRSAAGVVGFENQDSSLLTVLSQADVLIRRPVGDPARAAGDEVAILPL